MISYLDQLKTKCMEHGIFVHKAFLKAGLDPSTYSRTRRQETSLSFGSAVRVWEAIGRITEDQKATDAAAMAVNMAKIKKLMEEDVKFRHEE